MRLSSLGLILGLTLPALAADDTDAAKMRGFWKPTSVVYDGVERFPEGKRRESITLVVKDNQYRMYVCLDKAKDEHSRLVTSDFALDEKAKTIALEIKDGPNKGQKCHGLYELKDGKLRICYGPADKAKPTEFGAPAGSGYFCETWTPE